MARHVRSTIHNSHPLAMTIENDDNFSIVEFVNLAISAAWSRSYGEKAISIGFQPLFPASSRTGTSRSFAKAMLVAESAPATIRVENRERCNRGILSRDA